MKTTMKTTITTALTMTLLALGLQATALADQFNVAPGLSRATFVSEATFETINGNTSNLGGELAVDLADAGKASGSVTLDVASLKTGVDMRDEHLRSDQWLDAGKHPNITFKLKKVDLKGRALKPGQKVKGQVTGELTIKGVTRTVTAPVEVTFHELPPARRAPQMGLSNDLLRIHTELTIKLSDFGIEVPAPLKDVKLANDIKLALDLTAVKK